MATTVRLSPEIDARISHLSKTTGRSKTFYINEMIESSIDRIEYEYSLMKDVEDYRAGRLETYSLSEAKEKAGL